jgi:hypothetical protein
MGNRLMSNYGFISGTRINSEKPITKSDAEKKRIKKENKKKEICTDCPYDMCVYDKRSCGKCERAGSL